MSETNNGDGNATGMKRVLSLSQATAPKHALTRAQRAEVERLAYDMVIQECAKVHEHYLTQIPDYTARMVQDALLHYQLIAPIVPPDISPASDAPAVPETPSGDTPPADTIEPQGENGGLLVIPPGNVA